MPGGDVIGYVSESAAAAYAGQAILAKEGGGFALSGGKSITAETLRQMLSAGLVVAPDDVGDLADVSSLIPDRVEFLADGGPVHAVDRQDPVARISYMAARAYEGELLYRTNLDDHFVTQRGHVIDAATLQELGELGHVLPPAGAVRRSPFSHKHGGTVSAMAREHSRQKRARLAFLVLALSVALSVAYAMATGVIDITNTARDSIEHATPPPPRAPLSPEGRE